MQNDFVSIAAVGGMDLIRQIHIGNLLKSHGIDSAMSGSLL